MQVHAIYEDGRLTFEHPIRLKTQRIEMDINIPDNYIEEVTQDESKPVLGSAIETPRISPTRERLNAILGPWRGNLGSIAPIEVKDIWHEHLEEKYLGSKR
jgi:hypothetical protein